MNMTDAKLIDGVEMNAAYPETFQIPDDRDRQTLNLGDHAKIGLTSGAGGERFWVEITGMRMEDGETVYKGAVDNDLVIYNLPLGESIEFRQQHVLSIIRNTPAVVQ